jgi:hypothetical protein
MQDINKYSNKLTNANVKFPVVNRASVDDPGKSRNYESHKFLSKGLQDALKYNYKSSFDVTTTNPKEIP